MASLIGPRFDQRIVNRFVKKMMNGEVITVVQQPKRMGFLDVEDAVNAIIAVSNTSVSSWQSVYNVGNGIAYTVEEIYEAVAAEMKIRTTVSSPILESGNEISSTAVSYEQLKIDTGFIPSIDLNESIKRIIAQM